MNLYDWQSQVQRDETDYTEIVLWGHCYLSGKAQLQIVGAARLGQTIKIYGLEYCPDRRRPLLLEQVQYILTDEGHVRVVSGQVRVLSAETGQKNEALSAFLARGFVVHPQLALHDVAELYWVELKTAGLFFERPQEAVALCGRDLPEVQRLEHLEALMASQEEIWAVYNALWRAESIWVAELWRAQLPEYEEAVLLKQAVAKETGTLHALGLLRQEKTVRLYILQYAKAVRDTLRDIQSLTWGERHYALSLITAYSLAKDDQEAAGLIAVFGMPAQWDDAAKPWEKLSVLILELAGAYETLSALKPGEAIGLNSVEHMAWQPLRMPLTMDFADDFPQKIALEDEAGPEIVIEAVYKQDPWRELKWQQAEGAEETTILRQQMMRDELAAICLPGQVFPVIVYRVSEEWFVRLGLVAFPQGVTEAASKEAAGCGIYVGPSVRLPWRSWEEAGRTHVMLPIPLMAEAEAVSFTLEYGQMVPAETIILRV